jgi:hypothetical protein
VNGSTHPVSGRILWRDYACHLLMISKRALSEVPKKMRGEELPVSCILMVFIG